MARERLQATSLRQVCHRQALPYPGKLNRSYCVYRDVGKINDIRTSILSERTHSGRTYEDAQVVDLDFIAGQLCTYPAGFAYSQSAGRRPRSESESRPESDPQPESQPKSG